MSRLSNDVENINLVPRDSVTQLLSGVLTMLGVAVALDGRRQPGDGRHHRQLHQLHSPVWSQFVALETAEGVGTATGV
jgi:hypothetical protein